MKIVIVGSGGRLGTALTREYREKFDVTAFNPSQLNLAKPGQISGKLSPLEFNLLINCAAMTNVKVQLRDLKTKKDVKGGDFLIRKPIDKPSPILPP